MRSVQKAVRKSLGVQRDERPIRQHFRLEIRQFLCRPITYDDPRRSGYASNRFDPLGKSLVRQQAHRFLRIDPPRTLLQGSNEPESRSKSRGRRVISSANDGATDRARAGRGARSRAKGRTRLPGAPVSRVRLQSIETGRRRVPPFGERLRFRSSFGAGRRYARLMPLLWASRAGLAIDARRNGALPAPFGTASLSARARRRGPPAAGLSPSLNCV